MKKKNVKKSIDVSNIEPQIPYYDGVYDFPFTTKEDIKRKVIEIYNQSMHHHSMVYDQNEHSGGQVRQLNGDLVENLFKMIAKGICEINGIKKYKICKGKEKKKNKKEEVSNQYEEEITVRSKSGFIKISVDVHMHIYSKNTTHIYTECKCYLDTSFMKRAHSDLSHLKKNNGDNKCLVMSFENAINIDAENYFMDQEIIDRILYIVDGKRSSQKPIWKDEYYKPINEDKLDDLIDYLEELILNNYIEEDIKE